MDEEEKKKAEQEQAGQKTAHVAGKAAATYFGGPLGNKIYNVASNTKAGQAIENTAGKVINAAPGMKHMTNAANKTGALDVADKGIDAASGSMSKEGLAKDTLQKEGLQEKTPNTNQSTTGASSGKGDSKSSSSDSGSSESAGETSGSNSKKVWKIGGLVLGPISGCGCFFLPLILIIAVFASTLTGVLNFFDGIFDTLAGDAITEQAEISYYNKLKEAQENAYQNYGVCIDVNLIHATLIAGRTFDDQLNEGLEECEDPESCTEDAQDNIKAGEYRKMEKYIDTLANMQIKRKKYGLYYKNKPECYTEYQSVYKDQCSDTVEAHEILVTDEATAKECMDLNFWNDLSTFFDPTNNFPVKDSSTPRLVARNDKDSGLFAFFSKRAAREKNYAYYYYIPGAIFEDRIGNDKIKERYCEPYLPTSHNEFAELSIGDWANMEESVYFWNLMDSFIEEYYDEYLTKESGYAEEGTKRYEDALEIIDRIYDVYTVMGPSRDCSEVYAYQTISNLCPDGVTVVGNHAGTYDLEEYVAGVVEAEMYSHFPMESKKALAVAARTYVMVSTNYCEQAIDNSSNAQNFNPNYSAESWQAAESTRGEILTENGRAFLAEYDSWDCPGSLTCTYKRLPSGETHIVAISDTYARLAAGGHGRGMSQIAAADMANQGYGYKEILSYFYNGTLAISTGGSGQSVMNGTRDEKLAFLFPDGLPTSSAEMQQYLTRVNVPLVDINGNSRTGTLTVHQAIASDVVNAFTEIAASGFPIKDAYCYSWRGMAGNRQTTSHHSYGVACDINANENYMIRGGSVVAGSFWKPGENPYSIESNGPVVQAFSKYGWVWGGSWNSSKDYMHFSFTGY